MNSFRFLFFFNFCPRIKSAPGSPISHSTVGNVYGADSAKMTFILRKEHKFLRNIYDWEVLKESKSLESLENCYVVFQKFVSLPVLFFNFCGFENDIKHVEPKDVADICREHYQDCEGFSKVYDEVGNIEIKNSFKKALSEKSKKIICICKNNALSNSNIFRSKYSKYAFLKMCRIWSNVKPIFIIIMLLGKYMVMLTVFGTGKLETRSFSAFRTQLVLPNFLFIISETKCSY